MLHTQEKFQLLEYITWYMKEELKAREDAKTEFNRIEDAFEDAGRVIRNRALWRQSGFPQRDDNDEVDWPFFLLHLSSLLPS